MKVRNIGVKLQKQSCQDHNCPFHGRLKVRGRIFEGTVTSSKMHLTVTVTWPRLKHNRKYERSELRGTRIHAHNPLCINAQKGDRVTVMETRPLSKTKSFVVLKRLGKDIISEVKEQVRDESVKEKRAEKTEKVEE